MINLAQYRKSKSQADKNSGSSNKATLSFEEKLKDFIHRPFGEPGTKEELISIFEDEQLKKNKDENEEG